MKSLVGKPVINVFRHRPGFTDRVGVIVGFTPGVNGGTRVQWPSKTPQDPPYEVDMVTNDLALSEDWPRRNSDGTTELIRLSSYAITPTLN